MKKLLVPIWLLVLIALVILIVLILRLASPDSARTSLADAQAATSNRVEDFYAWPIDRQVAIATVIARGEWKVEAGNYKCMIAEIIKEQPGTTFGFKVGDEFSRGNQRAKPNTDYGDGELIFFTGTPPVLQFIIPISNGRLVGGDVSVDTIRAMVTRPEHR